MDKSHLKEALSWVATNKSYVIPPNAKKYVSPRFSSEMIDCSMPMSFDNYSRCALGCAYCLAGYQRSWTPGMAAQETPPPIAIDTKKFRQMVLGEIQHGQKSKAFHKHFFANRFLLHWGGLADPFCNYEKKNKVTYDLLSFLGDLSYPTLFSFKGDTIFEDAYLKLFDHYRQQQNFAFQVSIITADDKLAKKVEVGVPSPTKRLRALKILSDMGYWTILRLRPFIVGVSDKTLDELLEKALAAGIKGISTEFFAVDHRCIGGMGDRYKWLADIIGVEDLMKYFSVLSPRERGGYCRLNRDVKEPYIKKIYTFCQKHGLTLGISDPDFKELCTSGSCCGMPDIFPGNPEMCNWSRAQLTYHMRNARRLFHTTGQQGILRLDDVLNAQEQPYWDEVAFGNEYVGVIGRNSAERAVYTPKLCMTEHWNNLRSPNAPCNYFHGKVIPIGLDEKGNYMYQYVESAYEKRWRKEGIDLTF